MKGGAQQNSDKMAAERPPIGFETETKFFEPSSDLQDVINLVAAESFKNRFNEDAVKSSLTIPHRYLIIFTHINTPWHGIEPTYSFLQY